MKKIVILLILVPLLGAGCFNFGDNDVSVNKTTAEDIKTPTPEITASVRDLNIALPVDQYGSRRKFKLFGEFFNEGVGGYYVGDDIEYSDIEIDVPVRVIADGNVRYIGAVKDSGGLIIIEHRINHHRINSVYSHLDLGSSDLSEGDPVGKGQFLANLEGENSSQTAGEQKHLHFALYEGDEVRLQVFEPHPEEVKTWINPDDFFAEHGLLVERPARAYIPETGSGDFKLSLTTPSGWDIEYIPSIQALNLFEITGSGTARERSQIFIQFYDAEDFQTLPTVGVFSQEDLSISPKAYKARRYEIEKRVTVLPFRDQPNWRNHRHIITDIQTGSGLNRYYEVASNPKLDPVVYEQILASIRISE